MLLISFQSVAQINYNRAPKGYVNLDGFKYKYTINDQENYVIKYTIYETNESRMLILGKPVERFLYGGNQVYRVKTRNQDIYCIYRVDDQTKHVYRKILK